MRYTYLLALIFLAAPENISGQNLDKFVTAMDTVALRKTIRKLDKYFLDSWLLVKARTEEIDHFKQGFVLTWKVNKNLVTYLRTFVFNLNSDFVTAYEQRFINDTLLSQGSVQLKNNEVLYIDQVIINRSSLEKPGKYWRYEVAGYSYEIFKEGILTCIYHTEHLNHYEMLFEKANKNNIRLVFG